MPPPEKRSSQALPAGAGVVIAAGLGAMMWLGGFALLW